VKNPHIFFLKNKTKRERKTIQYLYDSTPENREERKIKERRKRGSKENSILTSWK